MLVAEGPVAADGYFGGADFCVVVDELGGVFVEADAAVRCGVVGDAG